MRKIFFILILGVFILVNLPIYAAETVSIKELLINPTLFSGKEVEISGEAIGEPLSAPAGYWFNISADGYQVGVYVSDESLMGIITTWGNYKQIGDRLKVTGVFNDSCPQHKTMDIHARSVYVEESGRKREEFPSLFKKKTALLGLIICLTLTFIYLIKVKYGKRNQKNKRRV